MQVLDRLCLVLFTIFTALATIIVLMAAPHVIVKWFLNPSNQFGFKMSQPLTQRSYLNIWFFLYSQIKARPINTLLPSMLTWIMWLPMKNEKAKQNWIEVSVFQYKSWFSFVSFHVLQYQASFFLLVMMRQHVSKVFAI